MAMVVVVSLLICIGQLCQKQAVERWRGRALPLRAKLTSPWLLAGLTCLGLGMLMWLRALQTLPVSVAYPMLSLNFVWVALASHFVFGERTNLQYWVGLVLIVGGIACLSGDL